MPVERTDGTASVAAPAAAPRKIWLCADDYGISPAVSGAIRDLIGQGRINATSAMVVAPSFHRSEAASLNALRVHGARAAVGLHLTLSAPFRPLTEGFAPLTDGAFPTHVMMLVRGLLRQLDRIGCLASPHCDPPPIVGPCEVPSKFAEVD